MVLNEGSLTATLNALAAESTDEPEPDEWTTMAASAGMTA
jgi:hypothetical protein